MFGDVNRKYMLPGFFLRLNLLLAAPVSTVLVSVKANITGLL